MKGCMRMGKHDGTFTGDDLFWVRLDLEQMTEREALAAIDAINFKVYLNVAKIALMPEKKP